MLYQCALGTTVPQRIRHKDPYAAAEHERLEERATQSAVNHDCTGCHRKAPLYAGQSVSVINNDRTLWLPATVVRQKLLVELSTGKHKTTFVNVTQMLSSMTHTPKLKWLDNLSPLHQPQKLYSKHLLLPQYTHLLFPQHPNKLQPKALQQQPASNGRHL